MIKLYGVDVEFSYVIAVNEDENPDFVAEDTVTEAIQSEYNYIDAYELTSEDGCELKKNLLPSGWSLESCPYGQRDSYMIISEILEKNKKEIKTKPYRCPKTKDMFDENL